MCIRKTLSVEGLDVIRNVKKEIIFCRKKQWRKTWANKIRRVYQYLRIRTQQQNQQLDASTLPIARFLITTMTIYHFYWPATEFTLYNWFNLTHNNYYGYQSGFICIRLNLLSGSTSSFVLSFPLDFALYLVYLSSLRPFSINFTLSAHNSIIALLIWIE